MINMALEIGTPAFQDLLRRRLVQEQSRCQLAVQLCASVASPSKRHGVHREQHPTLPHAASLMSVAFEVNRLGLMQGTCHSRPLTILNSRSRPGKQAVCKRLRWRYKSITLGVTRTVCALSTTSQKKLASSIRSNSPAPPAMWLTQWAWSQRRSSHERWMDTRKGLNGG